MRILIPTHAFTDQPQSGLHTAIWNTAMHLAGRGHEIHVISTRTILHHHNVNTLRQRGLFLHSIADIKAHNLNKSLALACFLFTLGLRFFVKFDWIYIIDTSITPFVRFKLGAKLAIRVLAPPDPSTQHIFQSGAWWFDRQRKDAEEGWCTHRKSIGYRILQILTDAWSKVSHVPDSIQGADVVFCQNMDSLFYYKSLVPEKVVYLPNGVETAIFSNKGSPPHITHKFTFLFVGRIAKRYGIFELLDAFAECRSCRDDIELWIVGKGSEQLVQKLQIYQAQDPSHIYYFGEVPRVDISRYYYHCDALVNFAFYHGFPSSVIEAMYCGKPVIAPLQGGAKDVVVDGNEGYLVQPANLESCVQKMLVLASDRKHAVAMGRKGQLKVRRDLRWEIIAEKIESTLSC